MTFISKHKNLLEDRNVRRWNENGRAKSVITAEVYLRTLGLYCRMNKLSPGDILVKAKSGDLYFSFMDFVRNLEKLGKAGSYIARFKRVLRSWTKFNGINANLSVNIKDEGRTPTIENERIPSKDELSKILRESSPRGRVEISLMAFSGLRPESLGNFEGNDGLMMGDLTELKILSDHVEFDQNDIPSMVRVRANLSKAKHQYFSFVGPEGIRYIKEYLDARIRAGDTLNEDSPLLDFDWPDARGIRPKHKNVRTVLVSRDIREAVRKAGFSWRPYVLRAYHSTALDIAENKGLISHNWREFFSGHKGDISARYSTAKGRLPRDMIEEMRTTYRKCLPFLETIESEKSEEEEQRFAQKHILRAVGYSKEEIDKIDLNEITDEEYDGLLRKKLLGALANNGHKQKVIPIREVKHYIQDLGWEYVKDLGNKEAIVKLPDRL